MDMDGVYKSVMIRQKSGGSRVFHLVMNRPSRGNALSADFITEFPQALASLDRNPDVGVIILSGAGTHFCTGIDLQFLESMMQGSHSEDSGRTSEKLRREIKSMQRAVTAIEDCRKPVIAAIHGGCVGGGVDLITACDLRYSTESAFFTVKEVDLAITADLGTLQRLPRIVGFGNAMDLALTARRFTGSEAKQLGLVSRVFGSKEELERGVEEIAEGIGGRSPIAIVGTKRVLIQSRELTLDQGLDYVATWNSALLLSNDLKQALSAHLNKTKPLFPKL